MAEKRSHEKRPTDSKMLPLCDFSVTACPSLCREGLVWVDINWMDNGECLDLIEKVCCDDDDVIRHEIQTVRNVKVRANSGGKK